MDTAQVIERLRAAKRKEVADATGLKYMWLSRVCWGDIKEPSSQKIDLLRAYFERVSSTAGSASGVQAPQ